MARPTRIEKNGYYHVINRGVAKGNIYLDDVDFLKFLEIV
ncbi:MAG: transposase, partial [Epsilonproteobacteria bacterium]|nr:transposase [Campylobacterota bacterium]